MKKSIVMCVLASTILLIPNVVRAGPLYAVTFNDEFLSIDPLTGAGTLIGTLDSSMSAFGLADLGTAVYTFDQSADRLQQLDPATGHTLATIDIGVATIGEGGIAFRSDGIGFLSRSAGSTGTLWSFDLTVPTSTTIGTLAPSMDGLDFNGSDVLYGLSQSAYNLYTIDQLSGATTLVGPTGLASETALGGLTFAPDGTLYAVLNDSLYTLDPGTGAASLIGPVGFNDVSGLTAVIPAPGAILLGSIGIGCVSWLRRRRTL